MFIYFTSSHSFITMVLFQELDTGVTIVPLADFPTNPLIINHFNPANLQVKYPEITWFPEKKCEQLRTSNPTPRVLNNPQKPLLSRGPAPLWDQVRSILVLIHPKLMSRNKPHNPQNGPTSQGMAAIMALYQLEVVKSPVIISYS